MRGEASPGSWEIVSRPPARPLRGDVLRYAGYAERSAAPVRRLEAPVGRVSIILSLGPAIRVDEVRHTSFVAGLSEKPSLTEHFGDQLGIQIDLAPLGARRLLHVPSADLAGLVVSVDDLTDPPKALLHRVREAPTWESRFAILDAALLARLRLAPPAAPEMIHAWARLRAAHGAVSIQALATDVGWSRRRLATRFRAEVGLPPKKVARIMRFERVTQLLRAQGGMRLADIAYECGYADQAHLNRDFRTFARTTPTDFASRLPPDGAASSAPGS